MHGLLQRSVGVSRPPVKISSFPGLQRPSAHFCRPLSSKSSSSRISAAASPSSSDNKYGSSERVLDLSQLLQECDEDEDLIEDHDAELPVWEHEHRVKAVPFTEEELKERERFLDQQQQQPDLTQLQQQLEQQEQQLGPDLLPNPLQAVEHIANAYSAEQGFREMSVEELSVALTAGGLVDLLLDVRSAEEFASGPSIPNAVNVPLDQLSDAVRAGQLDDYILSSIAVVCASGQRSAQAAVRLSKVFGFQSVVNVAGGMSAWQNLQAGLSGGGGCGCGSGGSGGCSK